MSETLIAARNCISVSSLFYTNSFSVRLPVGLKIRFNAKCINLSHIEKGFECFTWALLAFNRELIRIYFFIIFLQLAFWSFKIGSAKNMSYECKSKW